MNEGKIAARYAKAIFELAKEKKNLDKVYQNLKLVQSTFAENSALNEFLQNPLLRSADKIEVLNKIFGDKVEEPTRQLFKLTVENKRELYLPSIARLYSELYKKEQNIITATLITSHIIDKELKKQILAFVKNSYQSEIELEEKIDEKIIGGFILRIDDQQFDASVLTQLSQIKKDFINTSVESIN